MKVNIVTQTKKLYILLLVIFVVGLLVYFFLFPTRGLVKVESYNNYDGRGVICQALVPECGYCPGKVHNNQCYVDPKDDMQNYFLR
jgi:hypothetical protein